MEALHPLDQSLLMVAVEVVEVHRTTMVKREALVVEVPRPAVVEAWTHLGCLGGLVTKT
jgi:hypothetical protein